MNAQLLLGTKSALLSGAAGHSMVTGTSLHAVDLHNTSSQAVLSLNPPLMH